MKRPLLALLFVVSWSCCLADTATGTSDSTSSSSSSSVSGSTSTIAALLTVGILVLVMVIVLFCKNRKKGHADEEKDLEKGDAQSTYKAPEYVETRTTGEMGFVSILDAERRLSPVPEHNSKEIKTPKAMKKQPHLEDEGRTTIPEDEQEELAALPTITPAQNAGAERRGTAVFQPTNRTFRSKTAID